MNVKTPSEVAAFAKDLFPSVKAFVNVLMDSATYKTALDFAKVLIDLQVFETIDQALVLGNLFEYLLDDHADSISEEEFSKLIAAVLAHSSLSEEPTVEFLFTLLARGVVEEDISRKNYYDFVALFKDLFVPKTEEEESGSSKPQLVSFVFRKKKHQCQVTQIYSQLKRIGRDIGKDEKNEVFKGGLTDFYFNKPVFKSQIKSLYLPCRSLCLFIVQKLSVDNTYPLKRMGGIRVSTQCA